MANADYRMSTIHIQVLHTIVIPYIGILCPYNIDLVNGIYVKKFHDCLYRLLAMFEESLMPLIRAELNPWCSISFNPAIVHPFGEVTLSISSSGWVPFAIRSLAAPKAVCAAIFNASCA